MATTYRSNIAGADDDPPLVPGGVLTKACFSLSITPALVAEDVLILAKIPAGVVVTGFCIDFPDCGAATTTVNVGDGGTAGDDDEFVAVLALDAAKRISSADANITAAQGVIPSSLPKYYSVESDLRATVIEIATAIATAKLFTGWIEYQGRRDG